MDLSPGFSVIYSNRMEDLRKVAVQWIKRHPLAPLEDEVFIVQSNGMAQWIKLALARDDGCGISAAVSFQRKNGGLRQGVPNVCDLFYGDGKYLLRLCNTYRGRVHWRFGQLHIYCWKETFNC